METLAAQSMPRPRQVAVDSWGLSRCCTERAFHVELLSIVKITKPSQWTFRENIATFK